MSIKTEILTERLEKKKEAYGKLMDAYIALADSGAQSYTIDKRTLTRLDLATIHAQLKELENEIDNLTAMLEGRAPRKAFGIIPRDF